MCCCVCALYRYSNDFIERDNSTTTSEPTEKKTTILFSRLEIGVNEDRYSLQTESVTRTATIKSTTTSHIEQHEAIKQPINSKQIHRSDAYTFLSKHIPPPPSTSPPPDDTDDGNDGTESPLAISTETLAKLNKLYEMRRYVRNSNIDLNDFNELLTHRLKKFQEFSTQTLHEPDAKGYSSASVSL